MLASGATGPPKVENGYTYTYNLLTFDWSEDGDKLSVEVVPRAWNDEAKRFGADEVRLGSHQPKNFLGSPNFRRAPRPVGPAAPDKAASPSALRPAEADVPVKENRDTPPAPVGQQEQVPAAEDAVSDPFDLVLLKFFRDLTTAQRLKALVELDALPTTTGMRT